LCSVIGKKIFIFLLQFIYDCGTIQPSQAIMRANLKIPIMKNIVKIANHLEMVGFIKANGTACRFVSMVTETEPKLKKGCPYKGVVKVSRKNGLLNRNFNNAVCKAIAEKLGVAPSEIEYEAGETWYRHEMTVDGKALPLCVHKTKNDGKYYLQYFPMSSTNAYRLPNGDMIAESVLEPYFYAKSFNEFKPAVIAVSVENIKELRASGVIMQASDLAEAEAALSA
jgi:hypothetical protein